MTGIGGVFFKARDPAKLSACCATHLGMSPEPWGGVLFRGANDQQAQEAEGVTVWHLAAADGDWFAPGQLADAGIEPVDGPREEFNGRFAWILDPEGNKVELWEPREPG